MNVGYCYADLPRSGLGNLLLLWARATVFAHINSLVLLTPRWGRIRLGPLLRGDRHKRWYTGYFDDGGVGRALRRYRVLRSRPHVVDPPIGPLSRADAAESNRVYVFRQLPHWSDYFAGIREYRDVVGDALYGMLAPTHRRELVGIPPPIVGVHVRRGDLREPKPGEDFRTLGGVRAPLSYFRHLIERIRDIAKTALPVTIFSDGDDSELDELLRMPHVDRSRGRADIVDLLLLSRSRIILTSPGSTFSYWSGFLSNAPIVHEPRHFHTASRPDNVSRHIFEGGVETADGDWPALLVQGIRAIAVEPGSV